MPPAVGMHDIDNTSVCLLDAGNSGAHGYEITADCRQNDTRCHVGKGYDEDRRNGNRGQRKQRHIHPACQPLRKGEGGKQHTCRYRHSVANEETCTCAFQSGPDMWRIVGPINPHASQNGRRCRQCSIGNQPQLSDDLPEDEQQQPVAHSRIASQLLPQRESTFGLGGGRLSGHPVPPRFPFPRRGRLDGQIDPAYVGDRTAHQ